MKIVGWTVVFLLMIGAGFTLGYYSVEPAPGPVVFRDRLVVPVPCIDALDQGDELVLLLGESIGAAARSQTELSDLVRRSSNTTQRFHSFSSRCRAFQ